MIKNENITIKDIAKMAEVSVATVDRVIHKRGKVSPAALERILAILDKTDYRPNLIARTLGNNKVYYVALLIPDPSSDEYWKQSCDGIQQFQEEWAQYNNVQVTTYYFDLCDKESFRKSSEAVLESNVNAVLSAPIFHQEAIDVFKVFSERNIPYIFFNTNIPEALPLSFIGQDLYQSGKLAAEILGLICHVPGKIVILHIYEDIHSSFHLSEKERGCKDYFEEASDKKFDVVSVNLDNGKDTNLDKELSKLLSDPQVMGILASTSKGTLLTASFLEKHKRNNIKLIGYDLVSENINFLRKGFIDFLIYQNPKQQARLGMSYLANHLLFDKRTPESDLLPLDLVSRQNLDSFIKPTSK